MHTTLEAEPDTAELQRCEPGDEVLMCRYREAGDQKVYEELVRRYGRELSRYLTRYLGDAALADDVSQNVWLQVHLKKDLFDNGRPFRPWLYSIAKHQAIDAQRKSNRHPTVSLNVDASSSESGTQAHLLVSGDPSPEDQMAAGETRANVRRALGKLKPSWKKVLELAHYHDKTYQQISEEENVPLGTVKSRLHFACNELRKRAAANKIEPPEQRRHPVLTGQRSTRWRAHRVLS